MTPVLQAPLQDRLGFLLSAFGASFFSEGLFIAFSKVTRVKITIIAMSALDLETPHRRDRRAKPAFTF